MVVLLTRAKARGTLVIVTIWLRDTLITYPPSLHLIFSGSSIHPPYFCPSVSLFLYPSNSFYPVSSTIYASARAALIPRISIMGCSHHLCESRIPGLLSTVRHKSKIGQVVMYCATVLWRRAIYTPISSSPTVSSATLMGGYIHLPFSWSSGPMPTIRQTALSGEVPHGIPPQGGLADGGHGSQTPTEG